jgi:hybrid cluster-associated redox disulfide protein
MVEPTSLTEMTISDVLDRWPQTAQVFQAYNMACVGCVVAPFYTIVDAALVYGVSVEEFAGRLAAVIDSPAGSIPPTS